MKKIATLLLVAVMMSSNSAFAQQDTKPSNNNSNNTYNDTSWGVGLGCLAVLATVVGITVASATNTPSTFSN